MKSKAFPRWPASPYKGLGSYTEEDAPLFAGRDNDIRSGAATLAKWKIRLLLLHGSTGCGKSSFLRAGLIPHLENASIGIAFARAQQGDRAPILLVRSTAQPLAQLADALYRFSAREVTLTTPGGQHTLDLRKALPDPEERDVTAFRQNYGDKPDALLEVLEKLSRLVPETLVLVFDQSEEVLTVDNTETGEHWRDGFFQFLSDFADAQFDLKLLIALRTEYLGRFASRVRHGFGGPGLAAYFLDELNGEQIKEAVLRPTARTSSCQLGAPFDHYRFSFDEGVVANIVDALRQTSGGKLAALQIVCTALYNLVRERPEPRQITLKDLQSLGGVEGSIERFLNNELFKCATAAGLSPGASEHEAVLWKGVLHGLVHLQPDGTVTTDLKPASALREQLGDSRLDFKETADYLLNARLLREVNVVEATTGKFIRCFGLGHDALGLVLRKWKDDQRQIGDLFVVKSISESAIGAQELAARISAIWIELDNAIRQLAGLEQIAEALSREVRECLGFDFVAIHLKNPEKHTIDTIHKTGLSSAWFELARHTTHGNSQLWDIEAQIAMHNPPRIEIIAGHDLRFNEYIFKKFEHQSLVRVYASIILASTEVKLETLRWQVLKNLGPQVDQPSGSDRRTVLEIRHEDWVRQSGVVIGTIEAGFHHYRVIPEALAVQMAIMAGHRAGDLHLASLQNVFSTIALSAIRLIGADAASIHFARIDDELGHYIYEAWEGQRIPSVTSPSYNRLGQQALQNRQTLFVPNRDLGHDQHYLREFYREAFEEGMRAEAAIPIFFSEEIASATRDQGLYPDGSEDGRRPERQGLLYVRFQRPHWFTKGELAWLELLAARAVEAIRQVTYYAKERDSARRLAHIRAVALSLASDPLSPSLLHEIAAAALNILGADIVLVYEYDEQNKRFLSSAPTVAGRLTDAHLIFALLGEMSAPALLVKHAVNVYAEDAASNRILSPDRNSDQFQRSFVAREHVKSTAALILRGGISEEHETTNEILGLMLVNYRTRQDFGVEERIVAETLASIAVIAIRNHRLRALSS
jgi:GAF domain-containing protein